MWHSRSHSVGRIVDGYKHNYVNPTNADANAPSSVIRDLSMLQVSFAIKGDHIVEIYEVYDKYDDGLGHNLLALCYSEVVGAAEGEGEMEAGQ